MGCVKPHLNFNPVISGLPKLILFVTINFTLFIDSLTEQCETRVLDEIPPDPSYDAFYTTNGAARSFSEYLSSSITNKSPDNIKHEADRLANEALAKERELLAFGIAVPNIQLAVVQFRDEVKNINYNNRSYLKLYWKEMANAWNHTDGARFWGSPFKDCGALEGRWLWPFSVTIEGKSNKVIATSFIAADIDQCNDALETIFGKKHTCDRETSYCKLTKTDLPSSYKCLCNDGYFLPNQSFHGFENNKLDDGNGNFTCIPCPGGCAICDNNGNCKTEKAEYVSVESLMTASISTILGACILCCFVLAAIVFRQRKCKAIATGMWTILETILFGVILLYSAVILHFFPASIIRCLLEPWCRELGFIICYGAIILKLYRHLVEFRTRKAHRWVVRDVDLLKYLCAMIVAVLCYLSAFTASSMDFLEFSGLIGLEEERRNSCRPLKWDYVTQAGEILILTFGLHLSFASRNANTQFRERQFLVASILIEFLVSSTYYTLRAIYIQEMSPTVTFMALFVRSQLTNTVTLGLIFFPKIWYQHKQGSHDGHHGGGGLSGCTQVCLGDPDIGDLTISEMNPEDIRAELKRLYTQLEILKNKTLRQDNPHISKRRGGRKVAHRRFSLQKKGSKDKALSAKHRNNRHHHTEIEVTEAEPSRTPEDSVCSVEGPTDTGGEISGFSVSK